MGFSWAMLVSRRVIIVISGMLNSYDFIPDSQVQKKGFHRSLHLPLETGAAASSPNSARSGSREVGDQ